jgi:hypothetical protein
MLPGKLATGGTVCKGSQTVLVVVVVIVIDFSWADSEVPRGSFDRHFPILWGVVGRQRSKIEDDNDDEDD